MLPAYGCFGPGSQPGLPPLSAGQPAAALRPAPTAATPRLHGPGAASRAGRQEWPALRSRGLSSTGPELYRAGLRGFPAVFAAGPRIVPALPGSVPAMTPAAPGQAQHRNCQAVWPGRIHTPSAIPRTDLTSSARVRDPAGLAFRQSAPDMRG